MKALKEPLLGDSENRHKENEVMKPDLKKSVLDGEGFKTPRWIGYIYMFFFVFQICLQ